MLYFMIIVLLQKILYIKYIGLKKVLILNINIYITNEDTLKYPILVSFPNNFSA